MHMRLIRQDFLTLGARTETAEAAERAEGRSARHPALLRGVACVSQYIQEVSWVASMRRQKAPPRHGTLSAAPRQGHQRLRQGREPSVRARLAERRVAPTVLREVFGALLPVLEHLGLRHAQHLSRTARVDSAGILRSGRGAACLHPDHQVEAPRVLVRLDAGHAVAQVGGAAPFK